MKTKHLIRSIIVTFYLITIVFGKLSGQGVWIKRADFPGTKRVYSFSFSIGGKGYVGCGIDTFSADANKDDFWEYDPIFNTWTQKANFGGGPRYLSRGFSIGGKGYVTCGYDSATCYTDLWEYNPLTDTWIKKANFPGIEREDPVAFAIGNKGYVGLGDIANDFWEYDPLSNTWTMKDSLSGIYLDEGIGISIGNKGYVGFGEVSNGNSMWEYDPVTNNWAQKSNLPGAPRDETAGFSIGTFGYIVTGADPLPFKNDCWEYNPVSDSWTQKANFGGTPRGGAIGFNIGNKGYIGLGLDSFWNFTNDFWEYSLDSANLVSNYNLNSIVSIFPNPFSDETNLSFTNDFGNIAIVIYNILGQKVRTLITNSASSVKLQRDNLQAGFYSIQLFHDNRLVAVNKLLIID